MTVISHRVANTEIVVVIPGYETWHVFLLGSNITSVFHTKTF